MGPVVIAYITVLTVLVPLLFSVLAGDAFWAQMDCPGDTPGLGRGKKGREAGDLQLPLPHPAPQGPGRPWPPPTSRTADSWDLAASEGTWVRAGHHPPSALQVAAGASSSPAGEGGQEWSSGRGPGLWQSVSQDHAIQEPWRLRGCWAGLDP